MTFSKTKTIRFSSPYAMRDLAEQIREYRGVTVLLEERFFRGSLLTVRCPRHFVRGIIATIRQWRRDAEALMGQW